MISNRCEPQAVILASLYRSIAVHCAFSGICKIINYTDGIPFHCDCAKCPAHGGCNSATRCSDLRRLPKAAIDASGVAFLARPLLPLRSIWAVSLSDLWSPDTTRTVPLPDASLVLTGETVGMPCGQHPYYLTALAAKPCEPHQRPRGHDGGAADAYGTWGVLEPANFPAAGLSEHMPCHPGYGLIAAGKAHR